MGFLTGIDKFVLIILSVLYFLMWSWCVAHTYLKPVEKKIPEFFRFGSLTRKVGFWISIVGLGLFLITLLVAAASSTHSGLPFAAVGITLLSFQAILWFVCEQNCGTVRWIGVLLALLQLLAVKYIAKLPGPSSAPA